MFATISNLCLARVTATFIRRIASLPQPPLRNGGMFKPWRLHPVEDQRVELQLLEGVDGPDPREDLQIRSPDQTFEDFSVLGVWRDDPNTFGLAVRIFHARQHELRQVDGDLGVVGVETRGSALRLLSPRPLRTTGIIEHHRILWLRAKRWSRPQWIAIFEAILVHWLPDQVANGRCHAPLIEQ